MLKSESSFMLRLLVFISILLLDMYYFLVIKCCCLILKLLSVSGFLVDIFSRDLEFCSLWRPSYSIVILFLLIWFGAGVLWCRTKKDEGETILFSFVRYRECSTEGPHWGFCTWGVSFTLVLYVSFSSSSYFLHLRCTEMATFSLFWSWQIVMCHVFCFDMFQFQWISEENHKFRSQYLSLLLFTFYRFLWFMHSTFEF
jgi:hypothetical protein